MAQASPNASAQPGVPPAASRPASPRPPRPFLGLLDAVIVADPGEFHFDGAIAYPDAEAAWRWIQRDLAPDLIDQDVGDEDPNAREGLVSLLPELIGRVRRTLDIAAAAGADGRRRLGRHTPSDAALARLPIVLTALRCHEALGKAQSFGRAANGIADDAALAVALQALPLRDPAIAALLMMAAVGSVASPVRLVTAAARIAGSADEGAIRRAGLGPLVEALLAHAQNQVPLLGGAGVFADVDLACRAVDRFHRLSRAVDYIEISRFGRWGTLLAQITRAMSDRLEPRLRNVGTDAIRAFRRGRDGTERYDADDMLMALNGAYLLATAHDCKDSLGVSAVIDQVWAQLGEVLEVQLERLLDVLRQRPGDPVAEAKFDTALRIAGLRFGSDYAEIMRRARETAERL